MKDKIKLFILGVLTPLGLLIGGSVFMYCLGAVGTFVSIQFPNAEFTINFSLMFLYMTLSVILMFLPFRLYFKYRKIKPYYAKGLFVCVLFYAVIIPIYIMVVLQNR